MFHSSPIKRAICGSICLLLRGVLPRGWTVWPRWAPGRWRWRREPAPAPPACGSWLPRGSWGGRGRENQPLERACNYYFFRRAERAQSQRLFQQVVESPTPFLRLCHLRVQLEEDLMLKIKNVYSSSKRLDVKSQNSFFRTFYRLSNRQNQTSFNDHDKPPLWPFHKVHKCN